MLSIVEFPPSTQEQDTGRRVVQIPVAMIRPNPYQPRKTFEVGALCELADSIRQYGLLQPISVRYMHDGFYELIAGERRLRASRLAGLTVIDALVVEQDDEASAVLALVENLQRENLHFLEEAEGYYALLRDHNFTQEALAQQLGRTQSAIANKLRILRLPPNIKRRLHESQLSERHARALLRLPDEELQTQVLERILADGMTVKETEVLIEKTLQRIHEPENARAQRITQAYRDSRLFINSVKSTVREMRAAGLAVSYSEAPLDEGIEIRLVIPHRKPDSKTFLTEPPTHHP